MITPASNPAPRGKRKVYHPFEHDPNRLQFKKVYESFGTRDRVILQDAFCEKHGLKRPTFRAKVCGMIRIFERELQWIVNYGNITA